MAFVSSRHGFEAIVAFGKARSNEGQIIQIFPKSSTRKSLALTKLQVELLYILSVSKCETCTIYNAQENIDQKQMQVLNG